jgi:hypothetical protein
MLGLCQARRCSLVDVSWSARTAVSMQLYWSIQAFNCDQGPSCRKGRVYASATLTHNFEIVPRRVDELALHLQSSLVDVKNDGDKITRFQSTIQNFDCFRSLFSCHSHHQSAPLHPTFHRCDVRCQVRNGRIEWNRMTGH